MYPDKIKLQSMEKSLTYETLSRDLEKLDHENLLNFARCYIKLYLAQQEAICALGPLDKTFDD